MTLTYWILLIAMIVFAIYRMFRRGKQADKHARPDNPQSQPIQTTAAAEAPAAPAINSALYEIAERVDEFAKTTAYPSDLLGHRDFEQGVQLLSAPEFTSEELLKYYNGFNFAISFMALEALAHKRDDTDILVPVLSPIAEKSYWTLYFALRALDFRIERPIIGEVLLCVTEDWTQGIMQRFLTDFLKWRQKKGEELTFGEATGKLTLKQAHGIYKALEALEPSLGQPLLRELRNWIDEAVDVDALKKIGRVWDSVALQRAYETEWISHKALTESVEELLDIFTDRNRRSMLLVGESGVGKTVTARALAKKLDESGWVIFEAGSADILAGQVYIGELEERIQSLVQKIGKRKVLWVVPNFHELMYAGSHRYSPVTVLDMLLPYIERGDIVVLGETQPAALERLIIGSPRVRTAMDALRIPPLSHESTIALAKIWIDRRTAPDSSPIIGENTLQETFQLTRQYLGDKATPGNLLHFLELTYKRASIGGTQVTHIGIDEMLVTLSQLTGLPLSILDERQGLDLAQLRTTFNRKVMGQSEAIDTLVERVAMIKAGLTDPTRPQGVFLFAGPTGTGKTEIAKTLASFLFGSEQRMIRLDMSEFQTPDSLDRLLGTREIPVKDDGALVNMIRKQPFSVVLLDEFEKAHPSVWDVFLQVYDDGRLTDRHGNTADFRHCIIIMTSNLGGVIPAGATIGFGDTPNVFAPRSVSRAIDSTFRKEFINRLDRVVIFQPLTRTVMREVLRKELNEVMQRRGLRSRAWAVEFDNSALEFLLDRGFTADLGARPLKRAIERYLLSPLAMTIVNHQFPEGDQFLFVRSNGKVIEAQFIDPDLPESNAQPAAAAEITESLTLKSIALDSRGVPAEAHVLEESLRTLDETINSEDWREKKQGLLSQMARAGFWDNPERFDMLGKAEYMDRIENGLGTARRLLERLLGSDPGERIQFSATLVQQLAQQLYLVETAAKGVEKDCPLDAFIRVEASRDSSIEDEVSDRFARQIASMYLQWAEKRRMRHKILEETQGSPDTVFKMMIAVAGYAAFDILSAEDGLHVLEIPSGERSFKRCKVRVHITPQPPEPAGSTPDALLKQARQSFAGAAESGDLSIVRRYREQPSPLVRDSVHNWRTGRLDRVLGGDFDLIS